MPQVDRAVIKQRAARLREAGVAALRRHLDAWVGREAVAVIEKDGVARLADFTSAHFPFSLAEKGSGDEGRTARAVSEAMNEIEFAQARRLDAPHPQPPLRKGEGAAHLRLRFTHHDGAHLIGVAA
jgi:hypothetical protein